MLRLIKGEDLSKRVVQENNSYYGPRQDNSVWLDFQRDANYRGPMCSASEGLTGAIQSVGATNDETIRYYLQKISTIDAGVGLPPPHFFVTWREMGIRALNLLTSHRIYAAGLVAKNMKVDGSELTPAEFLRHDLEHAADIERKNQTSQFTAAFFGKFNYEAIAAQLPEEQRVLFDIAYFLYFHEGYVLRGDWEKLTSASIGHLSTGDLQKIYMSSNSSLFSFDFHQDGSLSVGGGGVNPQFRIFVQRFLDRGDLWVNLPNEIRSQIKAKPEIANQIVSQMLAHALTIFFNQHYQTTKMMLAVPK